jgi:hypothetical protein
MPAQTQRTSTTIFRWLSLFFAWLALALALMGYMNNFVSGTFPKWSALEAALLPSLGALGVSVLIFYWLHHPKSAGVNRHWSKHLLVATLVFVGLFLTQYIGVRLVIAYPLEAL